MTTGIYKITNLINNKSYIGQSKHIEKRWTDHKAASNNPNDKGYEYPLYRAFRKYGLENFTFEIIEECTLEELNQKEFYWIQYYHPEYNQTQGGDCGYNIVSKLTDAQVREIKEILRQDKEGIISYNQIAQQYNVHKDTIRDINLGYSWKEDNLTYPIRISKYDHINREKIQYYCKDCGKIISKGAIRCKKCETEFRKECSKAEKPVTREELKRLIRTQSFLSIGKLFNVSDNTIRKWCDLYNLPRKKTDIINYTDEDWEKI